MDTLDDLLTGPEYARMRRCSVRTVERERGAGTGCRFIKIGRAVRYRRRDVLDFIEGHTRQSTSEKPDVR
jgi:Helix-turn-helix domain